MDDEKFLYCTYSTVGFDHKPTPMEYAIRNSSLASETITKKENYLMSDWKYGWRFLNAAGGTNPHNDREHYSVLPVPGEKWSDWTEHPNPAKPDGKDCGAGRLHVMLKPSAKYAPRNWWIWYVRWKKEDEVGRSNEKAGVARYQLRRVRPVVLHRMIRLGWFADLELREANLCGAYLWNADLRGADLRGADLRGTYLRGAYLRDANLCDAYLRDANLRNAYLRGANLSGTYLRGAYLCDANLRNAYLRGANLSGADLRGAYLRGADLRDADLRSADLSGADLSVADLSGAYLRGADLSGADLRDADLSGADLRGARGLPDIGKENENG